MKRLAMVILAAMAGCAPSGPPVVSGAQLTPLNPAATSLGTPKVEYIVAGTGAGQVTVHMPDGETLTGHYSLAGQGGFVTGANPVQGPTGIVSTGGTAIYADSNGNIWVSAAGPKTRMTCDAQLGAGHGEGVCKTNTGADYRLDY